MNHKNTKNIYRYLFYTCFLIIINIFSISDNKKLIDILNSGIVNNNVLSGYSYYYRFYQEMVKEHTNVNKLLNLIMIQELPYEFDFAVKVIKIKKYKKVEILLK